VTRLKSQMFTDRIGYPWFVWGLAATVFLVEYFARVAPGVMVDQLMQAFQVQAFALGNLSACFYYAYVGLQLPVGLLVDRLDTGRLLAAMVVVCAFGCGLFAVSKLVLVAALGRFIMGCGAAFAFVSALKLAAQWFPASKLGLLTGLTQALGMLGAAVAQVPLAYFVMYVGWRETLGLLMGIMLLLAILIFFFVKDNPKLKLSGHLTQSTSLILLLQKIKSDLQGILSNPQNWWNGLFAGLLYAPTATLAELWGVKFYREIYGISNEKAAFAIGMIFIGWTVGGPLGGWLSDYLQSRRIILQGSAMLSLVFITVALFVPHLPWCLLLIVLGLYGLVNTGVATTYAVAAESNAPALSGVAIAFANMASVLVGAIFQSIIGALLDYNGHPILEKGVPLYTPYVLKWAMLSLPACLLLACCLSFKIKESYQSVLPIIK
jgi:nitrate/nitrite transporter NarK